MTMVGQSEKAISANAELSKPKATGERIKNFLHFLIEVIGYFATASERAKVSFAQITSFKNLADFGNFDFEKNIYKAWRIFHSALQSLFCGQGCNRTYFWIEL